MPSPQTPEVRVPLDHQLPEPVRTLPLRIGGRVVEPSATLPVVDPTTEDVVGAIPDAGAADVDAAVSAALAASRAWADLPWAKRSAALRRFADVITEHADEFALLDAVDSGNPLGSMRADALSAAAEARYFAGIAPETKGRTFPAGPDNLTFTEFVPYPVVARIVPFNHPLKFAAGKSAAPLAAGACVIVKPSEHTSVSALRLAELVEGVFPDGVFTVLTGTGAGAGAALAGHPDVPRVAFTGSLPTGARITELGAPTVKHVSLELGGKNPFIVFPDADPVAAARAAVAAMNLSRSTGQSCGSTSRVFVHESVREPFLAALLARVAELRVGDPLDPATDMGPIAFARHHDNVRRYLQAGVEDGATLLSGGGRPAGLDRGFFVEPTVFGDVDMSMRIAREEIFGPVMAVLTWSDTEKMLAEVDDVEFGLTANIWTRDLSTAVRTARRVNSGYVTVNGTGARPLGSPFGGFKSSGIGKESALDELLSYGREKAVNISL